MRRLEENPAYGPGNADYEHDSRRQREDELIDGAFQDILAGRFDSGTVREAMQLGHRPEYARLAEQRDIAARVAGHSRAT